MGLQDWAQGAAPGATEAPQKSSLQAFKDWIAEAAASPEEIAARANIPAPFQKLRDDAPTPAAVGMGDLHMADRGLDNTGVPALPPGPAPQAMPPNAVPPPVQVAMASHDGGLNFKNYQPLPGPSDTSGTGGSGGSGTTALATTTTAPAAPSADAALVAAQAQAKKDQGLSHLGALMDRGARAMTGLKPDDAVFARGEEESQRNVKDLLTRREQLRQSQADAATKAANDPSSDGSQMVQSLAIARGWATPAQAKKMTLSMAPMMKEFGSYDQAMVEMKARADTAAKHEAGETQRAREHNAMELTKEKLMKDGKGGLKPIGDAELAKMSAANSAPSIISALKQRFNDDASGVSGYLQAKLGFGKGGSYDDARHTAAIELAAGMAPNGRENPALIKEIEDTLPKGTDLSGGGNRKFDIDMGQTMQRLAQMKQDFGSQGYNVGFMGNSVPVQGQAPAAPAEKHYDMGGGKTGVYRNGQAFVRHPNGLEEPYRG